ncbi:protein kinase [Actinomadura sp. WMMA1423]|uniref:protein kinase domain-containing protein n=1 Tax=Actinomadura sp. WMMA1423 TaxID=2591108 RepID=UPI00143DDF30|nr:protein kinase [Actinomadura sp. WMMA1423]
MLNVPLDESFRFIHEPLRTLEGAIPLLGNGSLADALKERVVHSRGGTFLVAGFRGVGKTTLVVRALEEIAQDHPEGELILPVVLSVARPMSTEQLLFAMVRRIFETLDDAGVLRLLPNDTKRSLLLAYMRTSLSFKETRSDATERATTVDLNVGGPGQKLLGSVGLQLPKSSLSNKRTRSLATEAAFLAYSETDVEHDMIRIVRLLSEERHIHGTRRRTPSWLKMFAPRRLRRRRCPSVHLVVVLDEVDKLTATQQGIAEVEALLAGMKNVITMGGAHYVLVAGPELQDHVLVDAGRGNGLYESIFAWRLYVPCDWAAPTRLLKSLVVDSGDHESRSRLDRFELYLRFKARGVPRRLLHEFNSFVIWQAGKPRLRVDPADWDRIAFYAWLEDVLDRFFTATTQHRLLPVPIDRDRWMLGAYYVVDWILRGEGRRPFTTADVRRAIDDNELDPLLRIADDTVGALLEHLKAEDVLDLVRSAGATSTMMADVSESQLPVYRLAESAKHRLLGIAVSNEAERANLQLPMAPRPAGAGRPEARYAQLDERYELRAFIGQGGSSTVYEGFDLILQRRVAIKVLREVRDGKDDVALQRFLREAQLTAGLRHPNIVSVYEVVTHGPNLAIVMEMVEGELLSDLLTDGCRLPLLELIQTAVTMTTALTYLEQKGLARIDIKPANIMMNPERGPVIIDLGIARRVRPSAETFMTSPGAGMIGTPAYMAPEQINGGAPDIRADIFALGLTLYTCVNGRNPYSGSPLPEVLHRILNEDLDVSVLPVSKALRTVIARAVARDPDRRFQHPQAMLEALLATPEWDGRARTYDLGDLAVAEVGSDGPGSWPPPYTIETPVGEADSSWDDALENWTRNFGRLPDSGTTSGNGDDSSGAAEPEAADDGSRSMERKTLTTRALATRLGKSPRAVRRLVTTGRIPADRTKAGYRFSLEEVLAALDTTRHDEKAPEKNGKGTRPRLNAPSEPLRHEEQEAVPDSANARSETA